MAESGDSVLTPQASKKIKVFYGIAKDTEMAALANSIDVDSDEEVDERERIRKRKIRRELFIRRAKGDTNAPPPTRLPYPPYSDHSAKDKLAAMHDYLKMVQLGPDQLPSCVFTTLLGHCNGLNFACYNDNCSMVAASFMDRKIRVWTTEQGGQFRRLRDATDLKDIKPESEAALEQAMEVHEGASEISFLTQGTIATRLSFSPCDRLLAAGTDDGAVRMHSLTTWELATIYRGHTGPIWDVDFSPLGYYFATASGDKHLRLFNTEHNEAVRLMIGNTDDVTCVKFHPNGQYLVSGCLDGSVRMYDCTTGGQVRVFPQFHTDIVKAVIFSRCGRYIISADDDGLIGVWDIQEPTKPVIVLTTPTTLAPDEKQYSSFGGISAIDMSYDNSMLAVGDLNCRVHLWNMKSIFETYISQDCRTIGGSQYEHGPRFHITSASTSAQQQFYCKTLYTKKSPVFSVKFARRNLLWACGPFINSYDEPVVEHKN